MRRHCRWPRTVPVPAAAPAAIVHQFCSAEKEIMVERRKLIKWLCPDIHTDSGGVSLPKQLQFLLEHIHPDFGGVSLRKQLRSLHSVSF
jgi:hypothetical protein